MTESPQPFEDVIANRLLAKATGKKMERETKEPEGDQALTTKTQRLPSADFAKIEKNLASLGFFTPSSKRIKNEKAKTITFTRIIEGKNVEARATIVPGAIHARP